MNKAIFCRKAVLCTVGAVFALGCQRNDMQVEVEAPAIRFTVVKNTGFSVSDYLMEGYGRSSDAVLTEGLPEATNVQGEALVVEESSVAGFVWSASAGGAWDDPLAQGASKATESAFQSGDELGIYLHTGAIQASGNHSNNMCYRFGGTSWASLSPYGGPLVQATYNLTAYYPYASGTANPLAVSHTVASDQSAPEGSEAGSLEQSDFMSGTATLTGATGQTPTANLTVNHRLCKLLVSLNVPSTVDGAAVTGVNKVEAKNTNRSCVVNASTGAVSAPSNVGTIQMRLRAGSNGLPGTQSVYEAVVVPQTAAAGVVLVSVELQTAVGAKTVEFAPSAGLALEAGKKTTVSLTSAQDLKLEGGLGAQSGAAVSDVTGLTVRASAGIGQWELVSGQTWLTFSLTAGGTYTQTLTGSTTGSDVTIYAKLASNVGTVAREAVVTLRKKTDVSVARTLAVGQGAVNFPVSAATVSATAGGEQVRALSAFSSNQVWVAELSGVTGDWVRLASGAAGGTWTAGQAWGAGSPAAKYPAGAVVPAYVVGNDALSTTNFATWHAGNLAANNLWLQFQPNNTNAARTASVVFRAEGLSDKGVPASTVTVPISQAAATCTFNPTSWSPAGPTATTDYAIAVTVPLGVLWKPSVTSTGGWLTLKAGQGVVWTGTGSPQTINLSVPINPGAARTGTLTVSYASTNSGTSFNLSTALTVNQGAGFVLSQSPGNNIVAEGGTVTVSSPSAAAGLVWTAALSNTTGFTLGSVSGTGPSAYVPVTVAPNWTGSTRSTTLTATATGGTPTATVTITQNPYTFAATAPEEVPFDATSAAITITGTNGLTYSVTKSSGDANINLSTQPTTGTISGGTASIPVKLAANTGAARSAVFTVTCTTAGSNFSTIPVTVSQEKKTYPGDAGYITTGSDGTGLPAGLMCVGKFGGWNGSTYTKGLYIDKRGTNTSGVNQGTVDDGTKTWDYYGSTAPQGTNPTYNGLGNTTVLTSSAAANYCRNKGAGWYLPAIRQLKDGIWAAHVAGIISNEYSLIAAAYWSSTEHSISYAWWLSTSVGVEDYNNKYNVPYIRCVQEY